MAAKAKASITATKAPKRTAHPAIKSVTFEPAESKTTKDFHIEQQVPALGRTTLIHAAIEADPNNPRKVFDDEALDELAVSIAQDGLLQNLLVRPLPPPPAGEGNRGEAGVEGADGGHPAVRYRLVAGERRWRAIGRAIDKQLIPSTFPIPVDIRALTDEQAAFLSLLENMARKDLKPLEEARHFRLLIDSHGQSTASIAEKTGFTQRFVQQRLQLLELRPADIKLFEKGQLTIEQARNRVANYPKPLELPAAVWLAVLEVYDVSTRKRAEGKDEKVWLADGFTFDADLQFVVGHPHYLINSVNVEWESMVETGRRYTRPSYDVVSKAQTRFNVDVSKAEARQALIRELAEEVLGLPALLEFRAKNPPDVPYTTWVLAEPPPLSSKVFDQICESKAEIQRRNEAQEKANKARAAAIGEAFNRAVSIETKIRKAPPPALDTRFVAAAADAGWNLPLFCDQHGAVIDAQGRRVMNGGNGYPHERNMVTQHKLIVVAVNAAAGLGTPERAPRKIDPDAPDEDTFLQAVAEALVDEGFEKTEADQRAAAALAAFLQAEDIEYGDAEYDWDETGAMSLVHGILEDGLGALAAEPAAADQEDGADPELTPALKALAGVKPAAEPVEA